MNQEIRVRFAPSPTGALHIGGVRTALYNYLFAKKHGGKMILRIEDTDQERYVEGAEDYIKKSLEWLGIHLDESPDIAEGEFGPYRQSERKGMYQQYVQKLIDEGNAYYAFDTSEELEAMRERLKAAKVDNQQYNAITRMQMKNSFTLSDEEVKQKIEAGEPYVVRLNVPKKEDIRFNDVIRGWVMVHSSAIDDKVIMKSDGMPTYHLANVVDDHLMKVTHVIRGEEWLPSAPLHVLLYKFLGWESEMPTFAHLPLILKPDGNGKLSKRDGDKFGFPVFPIDGTFPDKEGGEENYMGFKEAGYLPDAVVNFLAFLGWNPGTEQEIFQADELIEAFSLEKVGKSGAKFNIDKAKWFNQQYIKAKSNEELAEYLKGFLAENSIAYDQEKAIQICEVMKERITFPEDLWEQGKYFFLQPETYDSKVTKKKWTEEAVGVFEGYKEALKNVDILTPENAKEILNEVLEAKGTVIGRVMQALRLAITGLGGGPDLMVILAVIGKEAAIERIEKAIATLPVKQPN